MVNSLRELCSGARESDPVFPRVPRIEHFCRDLKRAGVADFHALTEDL
jgi:hypothetical protein